MWENAEGWAHVRTLHDRYLGWARMTELVHQPPQGESLRVTALRGHAFAGPKVSQPVLAELAYGARVFRTGGEVVEEGRRRWQPVELPDGRGAWVQEVVLAPPKEADPVAFALRFLEAPYLWGGRSAWGLDCSGLTQTVYAACGHDLPRDADQQQQVLTPVETPLPGDLAFFPGHVGLMIDARRMIHANATHMSVTIETLGEGDYGARLQASCTGFGRWPG
ncbi:C40 family peptidase [Deinococcus malanensis]|uniref:C40 family peptidase n=1 Tax=Deinococcus malanensis TaxID=1706855 RepID=UPI00362F2E8B